MPFVRHDPWDGYGKEIVEGIDELIDIFEDHSVAGRVKCKIIAEYAVDTVEPIQYITSELVGDEVKIDVHTFLRKPERYNCGSFDMPLEMFTDKNNSGMVFDKDVSNSFFRDNFISALKDSIQDSIPRLLNDPEFVLNKYKFAGIPKEAYPKLKFYVSGYIPVLRYNNFKEKSSESIFPIIKPINVNVCPTKKHAYIWEIDKNDISFNLDDWKDIGFIGS